MVDKRKVRERSWLVILPLVLMAGLFLRTYHLGGECLKGGDALVYPFLLAFRKGLYLVLIHSYGMVTPIVSIIFLNLVHWVGFNVNEFWMVFPFVFIGTITLAVIYCLVKELYNSTHALIVLAFTAIMPEYVHSSRYSYGYDTVSLFLAFVSLYFFVLYLKNNSKRSLVAFSVFMSLYIISHALFLFMFIVLIWTAVVIQHENNFDTKASLASSSFRKSIIIPSVLAVLMLLEGIVFFLGNKFTWMWFASPVEAVPCYGNYQFQSMVGHYLLAASENVGSAPFHEALGNVWHEYGIWPILVLVSIVWGTRDIAKYSRRSIFFVWGGFYLVLFFIVNLFLCSKNLATRHTYFCFGAVPMFVYLVLLASDGMLRLYKRYAVGDVNKILFLAVVAVLFAGLFLQSLGDIEFWKNKDNGIKSAGFYMKNYTGDLSVFCYVEDEDEKDNDWGVLADYYYFGRKAQFDNLGKSREEMQASFEKNIDNIDVVIVRPVNARYFNKFHDFELKARVFSTTHSGRADLLFLFGKKGLPLPRMNMEVNEYNRVFDMQFTDIFFAKR